MINFLLDEKKTFAEGKNKLQAKKLNPIQVGGRRGGGGTKRHSTPSADWCKISSLYLVPVANY